MVTGKFFRDVELYETTHRRVLFTNAQMVRSPVRLPMARLHPSTEMSPVTSIAVEIFERLEAVRPDGEEEFMISTGGDELLDDLASVLSFALNATVSADLNQVRRLVPAESAERNRSAPAHILRRTADPLVSVLEPEIDDLVGFVEQLVALNRTNFELAMRAIRQVVNACRRVADDPTLAYTMFVAALEALSAGVEPPKPTWNALDSRKRKIIEPALEGLDAADAERIRDAILEAERAGATRRFIASVLGHLSPSYYRAEAIDAIRPLSALDLEKALKRAYAIRSRSVHILENLRREAWVFTDRADSVNIPRLGLILSLEGLNRLSRHVIRGFVARASTEQEEPFDYRSVLPNILKVELSPEYWIFDPKGLSAETAGRYLNGFVETLIKTLGSPTEGTGTNHRIPVDMRPLLTRVEELVSGLSGPPRLSLIAIYWLWHAVLFADFHQPSAERILARYGPELEGPSIQAFVVATLLGKEPPWTTAEYQRLAQDRHDERSNSNRPSLPAILNAALAASIARRMDADERHDEAKTMLARAVEESPGNARLMATESAYRDGAPLTIDLRALVLGQLLPDRGEPDSTGNAPGT